jgi:pyruvate dehydrogenase E1 component alpha subunit
MYKMAGKIRGFFSCICWDKKRLPPGCMTATQQEDILSPLTAITGLALAKGSKCQWHAWPNCMAKQQGLQREKGGSMHFFSKEHFFYWRSWYRWRANRSRCRESPLPKIIKGTDNVGDLFFSETGLPGRVCYTRLSTWQCSGRYPVIFICENNNYAMGTSVERTSNVIDIYKLADAYEMPGDKVDGMSAEAVHESIARAV